MIDSNVNRSDSVSLRLAANLALPDGLRVLPAVYYQRRHSGALPLTYSTLEPFEQANTVPSLGDDRFVLPSLTVNYDVGGARLTSVTSYFDRRDAEQFDYSLITMDTFFGTAILPGFENYQSTSRTRTTQQNFTQELRVSSTAGSSPFSYTVGAFYQHSLTRFAPAGGRTRPRDFVGDPVSARRWRRLPALAYCPAACRMSKAPMPWRNRRRGSAELSYNVTSHLRLTGGVRVAHIKVSSQFDADGLYNGGPTAPDLLGLQTSSETPVNPKGTISYQFDDSNLAYVTASRGFRAGGPDRLCRWDGAARISRRRGLLLSSCRTSNRTASGTMRWGPKRSRWTVGWR